MPTENQINAALRHVYTVGGTVLTMAAVVAVIPQDSVQPAIMALHDVGDGLHQAFGGATKLLLIVGPALTAIPGARAFINSGFGKQLASVISQAKSSDTREKSEQVAVATATLPEVEKIVAPALADAPSPKVVSQ